MNVLVIFTLKFIYYNVIDFLMIFTITVLVCVQNRFRYSYTSTFLPYIIIQIIKKWMTNIWSVDYLHQEEWWFANILSSKFISNKLWSILSQYLRWACLYHSMERSRGVAAGARAANESLPNGAAPPHVSRLACPRLVVCLFCVCRVSNVYLIHPSLARATVPFRHRAALGAAIAETWRVCRVGVWTLWTAVWMCTKESFFWPSPLI